MTDTTTARILTIRERYREQTGEHLNKYIISELIHRPFNTVKKWNYEDFPESVLELLEYKLGIKTPKPPFNS